MTVKTISGNYPSGFTLSTKYSGLILTSSASVEGNGVDVLGNAYVKNYGTIADGGGIGTVGLYMTKGGSIVNDATISGSNAIQSSSAATMSVVNFGTISATLNGVALYGGGSVSNLGVIDATYAGVLGKGTVVNFGSIYGGGSGVNLTTGLVENYRIIGGGNFGILVSGAATVVNYGTVGYLGVKVGVDLESGGSLVNGYTNRPGGLIYADKGVEASAAAVKNYGTIISAYHGSGSAGVILTSGATLANGTVSDRSALIEGYNTGLAIDSSASRATNFGTIECTGTLFQPAVYLDGGLLTNGGGGDTTAILKGQTAVVVVGQGTVDNLGSIAGTGLSSGEYGIDFNGGGRLTNGSGASHAAKVTGYGGVEVTGGAGSINNYGTIAALGVYHTGVLLGDGGEITNGALNDTAASISGYVGVSLVAGGSVTNFGVIGGATARGGIELTTGGAVTNGAATDQLAWIEGLYGVYSASGALTVANFGSIVGLGAKAAISNTVGARVTNGSAGDTAALIQGSTGVELGGAGTVANYATIQGLAGAGVSQAGGVVTNGAATDRKATVEGSSGVKISGTAGTVSNFGTILGDGASYAAGVYLSAGGKVTNGGGADRLALIEGENGIISYGSATVGNSGTILGDDSAGVDLAGGGLLTNGSLNNAGAQISGLTGVAAGDASVANFGTITGLSDAGGYGVRLLGASSLTNGAAGHATALIEGYAGVYTNAANATVTNFGTIAGLGGGVAVDFYPSANDTLVVEAGSTFVGAVLGGGGTLDLGSGTGTISNLGATTLTVSGSMAATTFQGFNTVEIDAPASFTLAGTGGTIAAGQALVVAGTLAGTGTLALTGGTSTFNTGADLTIAKVTETGAATVANFNGTTITVADVWTQTSGQITVATGDKVNFTGVGDTFSGTLSGAGTVGFTGGTDALTGTKITAATTLAAGATVTLSGAIDLTSTATVTSANVVIAAAGATLSGAGTVSLTNAATNAITGATAGATLTNGDTIKGAGLLGNGQMVLINQASGVINATLTTALTINTGTSTVTNAGMIENAGTGGLIITGAVANTGTLNVTAGTLAVNGAVTGAGTVRISGGTADFASTFTENVTFTTTGGTLELAKSQTYTGQITGFAKTPVSSLDLLDITFGGSTKATFSGTTTSGVLTVTDGTHTSKITLVGNYTASTFTTASDGHGGTTVTDPPKPPANLPPMLPLVTAMAGFGSGAGASPSHVDDAWRNNPSTLASPGNATA